GTDKRLTDELITARQRLQAGIAGRDDKDVLRNEEERASGTLQMSEVYANFGGGRLAKAAESVVVTNGPVVADSFICSRKARVPPPAPPPGQEPAVQVRNDFRSTILWQPDLKTDNNGAATVKVKY